MNDLLSGANSLEEARAICDQVAALLIKSEFALKKWSSNCKLLLRNIPNPTTDEAVLELSKDIITKTLGIQ